MDWKITLAEPYLDEKDINAVIKVLESGWLTMGPKVNEFERLWCEKTGAKHAFAVSSGTAALHLAMLALGIGHGDEVICPALSFVATANAARYVGAKVVFCDVVSLHDLTIDPDQIKSKMTDRTKAIVVMHYGGFMCNMDQIMKTAEENNIFIIEDSAHAPLSQYMGSDNIKKFAGTIGHFGAFSFYGNKNMTTAEGGMVTTNSDEYAEKIRLLRSHGMTSLTFDRHKGHNADYDVVATGYNYRMDDIRAALGISQLEKLEKVNKKRQEIFKWYMEDLRNNENIILPFKDHDPNLSSCHLMAIIIKNDPEKIKARLTKNGVQSSRHYIPIPEFKDFDGYQFEFRDNLVRNILTLPLHPNLNRENIKYITNIINSYVHANQ